MGTAAAAGLAGATALVGAPTRADAATAPTPPKSRELAETASNQNRWLSLPASRLVVNPYDFNSTRSPLDYSLGPDVPLNLGYYVGNEAARLNSLAGWRPRIADEGSIDVAWADEFDTLSGDWVAGQYVTATVGDGRLQLNLRQDSPDWWGELTRWVEVNLDASPYLQISVTSLADAWGLQVRDASGAVVTVQSDSNSTGVFTYNLAEITRWSGTKSIQLVLRVAVWEKPAEFDFIRIIGVTPALGAAGSTSAEWYPHELPFTASYDDGSTATGTDFFINVNSVARTVSFAGPTQRWSLTGVYAGAPTWSEQTQTLTVVTPEYAYAIAFSAALDGAALYYETLPELLSDTGGTTTPPASGYWAVPIRPGGAMAVSVAFATAAEGGATMARRRARAALGRDLDGVRGQQERFWDGFLASVPHPTNFAVQAVDPLGVTPAQVRHSYYAAWVFLHADVLPPLPEVDFPYPQLPTGKPSLWAEGADGAVASAQWESVLAMQFYAYVDPATAWGALKGMLSLVDDEGIIGGEGLPARKAQTAAVLYALTGDTAALRDIYPALRRHLLWQEANPRWVFKDLTPPDQKDAQFLASVLIDMAYARDIARLLGLPDDVRMWGQHRSTSFANYLEWFWETPTSEPIEWYVPSTGTRDKGNILWISCGFHLDLWPDDSTQLDGMIRRFESRYNPDLPFAGFAAPAEEGTQRPEVGTMAAWAGFVQPKYADTSYTIYGLLGLAQQTGDVRLRDWAVVLSNSCVRDVVRANEFAEVYTEFVPPKGAGVRPSFFGAGMVLDGVLMNNGYRMDLGTPAFVRLTDNLAAVHEIVMRGGKTLTTERAAGSDLVELSGTLVRDDPVCTQLTVPLGATVSMSADCGAGALAAAHESNDGT